MSDEKKSEAGPACKGQLRITKLVEAEHIHTNKRLARSKVATVLQFTVYAFNCDEHGKSADGQYAAHIDYAAGGGRTDIPQSLQASINGVEHLLATLKAKVQ